MNLDDRPIFLVGFMGSGKSRAGAALARRMHREFVDTDLLVADREGRSVGQIFRESGEAEFRRAEWEALRSLKGQRGIIVATGGGLFLGSEQRRWMKEQGRTVWLDVPLEVARSRVGQDDERPLWLPRDPIAFRAFFEQRRAVYALAALRVDAAPDGPEELAQRILTALLRIFH